ncbi:glutamate receptor-interacting protein 2 isoform X1 [Drosophila serrata]|uniref:glutamate receptor-interacting protein 2 isoform X1 n=2 Tax=Drosophila serrata TaxID=7274 RepID=UPI000A1CFE13|nr:glutamate receptor-interacting protein 2 isoform X1 [Drosophila serrata]XP_020805052.1 glutamate receptor-interacting protein 2 isoform X1 [Drosophila serrata]
MKLWKSKKPISGCVPGKSAALKQDQQQQQQQDSLNNGSFNGQHHHSQQHPQSDSSGIALAPMLSVDRAMSPAQSEDSGLAPERGTTYATITLPRNALHLAITFAERNDLSYPPVVGALSPVGHAADFLAPGDRLHQIDGISTIGLSNQKVMNMLCSGGAESGPAIVEIEYSLPEYTVSQNSLCVTSKLAQITVERESGCLGLTLRGGADYPLIVTHVRPHGPVYKTGRIKPGDRLLRVDNVSLIGKTLAEAQQIIKCGGHVSGYTNLTIEYDVSVVQSVEFSMGPLLIEIERPMNDKLGLVLCNYTPAVAASGSGSSTPPSSVPEKIEESAGVFIASILPASIADRCGALSVGDQVLSIDDTMIEHTAFSPDEVMTILDTGTGRGYTQMQIMPAHALARRGHTALGSPKYSFSTLESRKSTAGRQRQRFARKSSLPLEGPMSGATSATPVTAGGGTNSSSNLGMGLGLCRAESFPVLLDCSHGAGIILADAIGNQTGTGPATGSAAGAGAVTIAQILTDSVADRSGCIQAGDRIVAINKMYSLDAAAMRQLLEGGSANRGGGGVAAPANWLELEIEFDMPDAVVPSSGVFSVKLLRAGKCGLGLSVSGSSHGGLVIADVKMGSPAHRSGSLRSGDILLAVDQHPVQHFNVDALLKEEGRGPHNSNSDFTTLTIKRVVLPDFLPMSSPIYSNCPPVGLGLGLASSGGDHDLYSSAYVTSPGKYADCVSLKSRTPQPDYFRVPSMDDASLQSVQLRHGPGTGVGPGQSNGWPNASNSRSFVSPPNTQSLTTELPEEEDEQEQLYPGYELNRYASVDCTALPPPMESKVYGSAASSSSKSSGSSLHQIIFTVRLEPKGGLLGITLAGSEDITKPITISGLVEGGIAHKNGQIHVGDQLLAIDEHSVQGMPLSHATSLLQNLGELVDLKILRSHDLANGSGSGGGGSHLLPQTQAIYAKVQRRPRSPSANTEASKESNNNNSNANGSGNTNGNGSGNGKPRIFHVTLYKDKVYDDYGFSVSDGLYERGVFINRIRSGGPADMCGLLKPFDRIMQVNEMKTQDFDCCLTVPLIAAAGDKIEMIMQRTE